MGNIEPDKKTLQIRMILGRKYIVCILTVMLSTVLFPGLSPAEEGRLHMGDGMGMGFPLGGMSEDADLDLCPMGAHVIRLFLEAWEKEDFKAMYELIDDSSKEGYPFEQARLDLMLLKFKPYTISQVRKDGDDFEFILSHGNWQDGDKELRKMMISGETYKIIMPTKNSPFKKSAESYY